MPRVSKKDRMMYEDEMDFGYMREESENKSPAEVETTGPETINGIIANALSVNAREAASPSARVMEVLTKGERVQIIGESNGYYLVQTSRGHIVYVLSKFVSKEE